MIGAKRVRYESREPVDEKPGPPSIATIVPSDFVLTSVRGCSSTPIESWSPSGWLRSSGTSTDPHHAPVTSLHGSRETEPRVIGALGSSPPAAVVAAPSLDCGVVPVSGTVTTGIWLSSMTLLHPA